MTDYVPFTSDEYQPDAPATALHFSRWFQNWIAGFEGAAGAPRLARKAMTSLYLGAGRVAGTSGDLTLTGLAGVAVLDCSLSVVCTPGHQLFVAFSADNGATWGANQFLINAGGVTVSFRGRLMLNLTSGAFVIEAGEALALLTGTLTVPGGCNAVRIKNEHSTGSFSCMAFAAGGVVD